LEMRRLLTGRAALIGSCLAMLTLSGLGPARTALSGDRAADLADACTDDPYEPDDALSQARLLQSGQTQSHEHCDVDWVSLASLQYQAVYAVETTALRGGADTRLRLWRCATTYGCSHQTGTFAISAEDHGGGATPGASRLVVTGAGGLYDPALEILEEGETYGAGKGYDVSLRCLLGCPGAGRESILPAVTRLRGKSGSFFRTDLRLFNPAFATLEVELIFTTSGPQPERLRRTVPIGPNQTALLPDVLAGTFGLEAAFGWLEIRPSSDQVVATSRTYTSRENGPTFGEVIPAIPYGAAAGPETMLHLPHLLRTPSWRSNVGFAEVTGGRTGVEVGLVDPAGKLRASRVYELPPFGHRQLDDVFAELGATDLEEARVTLRAMSSAARITGFATVVDNETGDYSYVSAQAARTDTLSLPIAEDGETAVRIVNLESFPQQVSMRFLPGTSAAVAKDVTYLVPTGGTFRIDDATSAFDGSGVLLITPQAIAGKVSPLVAVARTRRKDGTGFSVPVSPPISGSYANRYTVPVADGATSLHVFNPNDRGLSLTMSLVEPGGATLGLPVTTTLAPLRGTAVFELPGTPEQRAGARLDIDLGIPRQLNTGPVVSYLVAATDSRSNDTLATAAIPLEGYDTIRLSMPGAWVTTLTRVPPTTRAIGSPGTERGRDADEEQHLVTVTAPYYIQDREVTSRDWDSVMSGRPTSSFDPKAGASFTDISGPGGFLEKLNSHLRTQRLPGADLVRLPTEAEWEIAARAGSSTRFWQGDLLGCDDGCVPCDTYVEFNYCGTATSQRQTGTFLGGLWEWVSDWYAPFGPAAEIDPKGPETGAERVIRGGGFDSPLRLCRSANRFAYPPDDRQGNLGFRIVVGSPAPSPR